jgi:3-oxoacyl-[acyl-carrier-protein] synthase-1
MRSIAAGHTGIRLHEDNACSSQPFCASLVETERLDHTFSLIAEPEIYTRFEKLIICSLSAAVEKTGIRLDDPRTLFILSTTKGNIEILHPLIRDKFENNRVYLWHTAALLEEMFRMRNKPLVVSNACISGLLAVLIGSRLIKWGNYDHVVITGGDVITEFVLSGFNSFKSLSNGPCRPFDITREGLSLGEGAGTIVISADPEIFGIGKGIQVGEGFSANDANHISGPSRTGEGLYIAITQTLRRFGRNVEYISAHGTATPYNDEMESLALTRAGLQNIPVNSFKGSWGHTLGAAGIIESVACIYSLTNNMLYQTVGFSELGVSHPVSVIDRTYDANLESCLKIASGFGGCNASIIFHK